MHRVVGSADYRYRISAGKRTGNCSEPALSEESPEYEISDGELLDFFSDRLRDAVDEERLLPDEVSVAVMAMKIGLSHIESSENSGKDVLELRNETWLETGKEDRLKEEIINELEEQELVPHDLRYLSRLSAGELLEFYRELDRKQS